MGEGLGDTLVIVISSSELAAPCIYGSPPQPLTHRGGAACGLGWSGLVLLLSNRAWLEQAGLGWQLLTKTGLQGLSQA